MRFTAIAGHVWIVKSPFKRSFLLLLQTASLVLVNLTLATDCNAESLSKLLELAISGEPTYQGAKANLQATEARSRQAVGALLPQVTFSANTNDNNRSYETRNINVPPAKDTYNSNSAQVNFTQPIWRYEKIVGLQQADAAMAQAQHQLTGTEQELFSKLVASWFDVLAARDHIEFAKQQVLATRRQWEVTRRGAELGTSGAPQADEAKAKYDQALADAVSAETDSQIKLATLEQLVGTLKSFDPPHLRDEAILVDLKSERLEKWLAEVEASNPNILAAQNAFEAASAEIRKQRAGHQPTLDLVGTYSNNAQEVGSFPGQNGYEIRQRSVGLQLNIPLYSGGTQSAKVSEAVAMREKARAEIEAARRTALLSAKQGWFGWQAAFGKVQAGLQTVAAAKSALKAARAGSANGLKSELDVLQAEQQLYAGLRDLRKAYYDQIASHVKLKAAVGGLTSTDVTSIDQLFVASASMQAPPSPTRMQPTQAPKSLQLKTSLALSQ